MNHHHGDLGVSLRTPWMARTMAGHLLTEWMAPAGLIDTAQLLVSELATNAILPQCGRPARGSCVPYITEWYWHVPGLVVMEISDMNEKPPEIQFAEDDSERGRGLQLVASLSREWGYYYPRKGWKTVYCVLAEQNGPMASRDCAAPAGGTAGRRAGGGQRCR
jgi:hypothetical protein